MTHYSFLILSYLKKKKKKRSPFEAKGGFFLFLFIYSFKQASKAVAEWMRDLDSRWERKKEKKGVGRQVGRGFGRRVGAGGSGYRA